MDTVRHIPAAQEFFALLETLYVFISESKAHVIFIEEQKLLKPDKQPLELQRLSETRWVCKINMHQLMLYAIHIMHYYLHWKP